MLRSWESDKQNENIQTVERDYYCGFHNNYLESLRSTITVLNNYSLTIPGLHAAATSSLQPCPVHNCLSASLPKLQFVPLYRPGHPHHALSTAHVLWVVAHSCQPLVLNTIYDEPVPGEIDRLSSLTAHTPHFVSLFCLHILISYSTFRCGHLSGGLHGRSQRRKHPQLPNR